MMMTKPFLELDLIALLVPYGRDGYGISQGCH